MLTVEDHYRYRSVSIFDKPSLKFIHLLPNGQNLFSTSERRKWLNFLVLTLHSYQRVTLSGANIWGWANCSLRQSWKFALSVLQQRLNWLLIGILNLNFEFHLISWNKPKCTILLYLLNLCWIHQRWMRNPCFSDVKLTCNRETDFG